MGTKLEKCPISQGFEGEFLPFSLNRKNIPHVAILTQNLLFYSRIEPENSENYVFEQIF